ncbi:MAG: hypothetical protein WB817_14515 [Terriglobales bacterium]
MRLIKAAVVIVSCLLLLGACAFAGQNSMGISDSYRLTFSERVRVADTLLPAGDYQIQHVMEGADHIMVFRQLGVKNPVEVRAKCTLEALAEPVNQTQKIFELNGANERVLKVLLFKGDHAKHVF